MKFGEMFKLAMINISGNKMRTFLTMLGIIIGVAAVMLIAGMGNGMRNYMRNQFKDFGVDQLTVSVRGVGSRSITVDQMYGIVEDNPGDFLCMTPQVNAAGEVRFGAVTPDFTESLGVSEDYLKVMNLKIREGRSLSYMDMVSRAHVCVVGQYINQTYYQGRALRQTLRIGGTELAIVGVLDYTSSEDTLEMWGGDNRLFMPYTTAMRMGAGGNVSTYMVKVADEQRLSDSQKVLQDELLAVFGSTKGFRIDNNSSFIASMDSMTNVIVLVLMIIAGISLLVGGIGIMNIMLVSVTERTREIGIRKALGAKQRAILGQFVLESATTSGIGGIFGIALGFVFCVIGNGVAASLLHQDLQVVPSVGSTLISFGISAGIGILFGFLPARKAARLNPIDALRYE